MRSLRQCNYSLKHTQQRCFTRAAKIPYSIHLDREKSVEPSLKPTSPRERRRIGSHEMCVQCPGLWPPDQTRYFTSCSWGEQKHSAAPNTACCCYWWGCSLVFCISLCICCWQAVHAGALCGISVMLCQLKQFLQLGSVHMRSDGMVAGSWGRPVGTSSTHEFSTHLSTSFHTGLKLLLKADE